MSSRRRPESLIRIVGALGAGIVVSVAPAAVPNFVPVVVAQIAIVFLFRSSAGSYTVPVLVAVSVALWYPNILSPTGARAVLVLAVIVQLLAASSLAAVGASRTVDVLLAATGSIAGAFALFRRLQGEPMWLFPATVLTGATLVLVVALAVRYRDERRIAEGRRKEIERLNAELERATNRLTASSRKDGMAQVARSVIHELGNPVNYARGNLEILRAKLAGPTGTIEGDAAKPYIDSAIHGLDTIKTVSERMRDLLVRRTVPVEPVRVRSIAESVVEMMGGDVSSRQVDIAVAHDESFPMTATDLHILIRNLVENAIEAAGLMGTVTIGVERSGDRYRLMVEDTGSGPPADLGETIYDPFVSTKAGNSGLGLAICSSLVGAYGGSLVMVRTPSDRTRVTAEIVDVRNAVHADG